MATKLCEYCNQYVDAANTKCPNCSAPLSNKVFADQTDVKETVATIVTSGINTVKESVSDSEYCSKFVSLILLLFGGFFGAHKFYEGKIALGILYIFTWGFLFIGLILDFFTILAKPAKYKRKEGR